MSVSGAVTTGKGKKKRTTTTVETTIASWSDTLIEAQFASCPSEVTVNALNGTDTAGAGKGRGKAARK
jgi:hypothetical protein